MTWETDTEFESAVLKTVEECDDGWALNRSDGWSFYADKITGHTPKPGQTAKFYGRGTGYIVRGLVVDGYCYFYRTPEEQEQKDRADENARAKKRVVDFRKNKAALDAAYNDLPPEFKRRLDRFRNGNPNFRRDFEGYEMSCCTDAVNIATRLKTVEAIEVWRNLPYEQQQKQVSFFDGHSGNSFGCAVMLAKLWLTNPDAVEFAHGALTPLVGCKDYGCTHEK